jgi:copper chaperone CopZ|tara:strand:- start:20 stop:328 length:309 start_codon:yes stop_codon:yes gene_type:complete
MKYTILILILALSFLSAKDNTTYIKVDGMQCSYSCAGKVNSVVQKMDGVKECTVDFDKGIATVVFDDKKLATKDIVEGLKTNTAYTVSECTKKQDKQEPAQI